MKFTVNRKILLEHLKTMVKIVPKESPIKELKGFLIEANEDDGHLYITATNMEVSIQRKLKTDIEVGGSCVIDARLLVNMLSLFKGDDVSFEEIKTGVIKIKSDKCVYKMSVLGSNAYPRPQIPFPDTTVKICDMKQIYGKTYSTIAKENISKTIEGVHFSITPNKFKVESCNLHAVSIVERELDCGGSLDFVLPKQSFMLLAIAADDDDLEVGSVGSAITFMKDGMMLSAKKLNNEYADIDKIISSLNSDYVTKVEFDDLKDKMLNICDISAMGTEKSYINIGFGDDKLTVSTENDVGNSSTELDCVMVDGKSGQSYYYRSTGLKDIFKTIEGTMILQLDSRGYLLVFDRYSKYLITPIATEAVKRQIEKYEERKKQPKKAKKPSQKAA